MLSESRKLIRGRGIKLNSKIILDEMMKLSYLDIQKGNNIISVGKKKHFKVVIQ